MHILREKMNYLEVERNYSQKSNWMFPVISDLTRFEYETILRADPMKRSQLEDSHRGFWVALLMRDLSKSRSCFTQLYNNLSSIGEDVLVLDSIDETIMDTLSEMIMVRSRTQKIKSRTELKQLMQAAVKRGEISGWWHAHH